MSQTYFAILTAVGEAKLANAVALNVPLQISRMAVGDGGGVLPVPLRTQTALIGEQYRADLNSLAPDPLNASQIIAELVIPETEGGYWLREMGLYDAAGDLVAVSNCPPSYKPEMAEGSGRTQVLRMVLIVSSTAAVQLKIDPSVVLATREFVTTTVAAELAKLDHKQSVRVATTAQINLSTLQAVDGVALAAGDRVLVKNMADAKLNGIYVAAVGNWARAADADASVEVTSAMIVSVEQGATLADTRWQLVTDGLIVLGTTALNFQDVTKGYAPLASPALTGNPTAPTQPLDDDSLRLANTEYVRNQIASPAQDFAAQVFRKNLLINGNFDIWQRATENPSSALGGYVTVDRFRTDWDGTALVNISRQAFALGQTAVPNEPSYFLRWQQVTAGAGSATHTIQQKIESVRTCAGKTVTLSFWAKADSARNITAELLQVFGTGGAPSAPVQTPAQVFALGVAWKKCVATFALPSIAGKTLGSNGNDCLAVVLNLPLNVLQTIDIAQIQLEESAVATPFESRPAAVELALCQRYYEAATVRWAANYLSTTTNGSTFGYFAIDVPFKATKRAIPTITKTNPAPNPHVMVFQASATVDYIAMNNGASYLGTGTYIGANAFSSSWTASAEL
ncbi:phage tail protein [Pseudomonas sp.]|uniref:phage tail protein n=1 Tax=Pseudomonas sp. TaxID=306 RepID=UPI002735C7A2|nr:phage tail protein [Pseudomonas sp.]MDP2747958.1 phage tail protein [Pseudomonas sp.]